MKKSLHLVLDTNKFIFGITGLPNHPSAVLLDTIVERASQINIHIPRTIFNEVRKNLRPSFFNEFITFINTLSINVDEDFIVPFEISVKYEMMGLKPANTLIASYTELMDAAALISENRHFLSRQPNLPFKVMSASQCLKMLLK